MTATRNSSEAAETSLRKAGVPGWVAVRAEVVEGSDRREVTTSVATKCLRNAEWKKGEDGRGRKGVTGRPVAFWGDSGEMRG
ncbi:hypothetical protein DI273_18980 [Streptomyces violascens]|nr:hypothetical protein DI273_18980 [Streptomyces violascens]